MDITDDAIGTVAISFLFCAMLCGFIAFSKDRSWLGFALTGLLLGPIGLVVTGFAEPGDATLCDPSKNQAKASKTRRLDIDKP